MTTRQKATLGVFILVVVVIVWQVWGLFSGPTSTTSTTTPTTNSTVNMSNAAPTQPAQMQPQAAQLMPPQPQLSQREMELMKLQQDTQAKYLAALNELQMLKVARELAETNEAIMKAKLETVTAQKSIVDLLQPSAPAATPATYASSLNGAPPSQTTTTTQTTLSQEVKYTVISVSQLQGRWSAVLGYQGNLYHVAVGDVLPADNSKVIEIDKSGVTLLKDTTKKKLSLVPII